MHHTEHVPGVHGAPARRAVNGHYEHSLPNPISSHIRERVKQSTVMSFFEKKTRRCSEFVAV